MNIGDLVMMKEDSFKIMGVVVDAIMDEHYNEMVYKVVWMDELCDPSFATIDALEAVCKLVT